MRVFLFSMLTVLSFCDAISTLQPLVRIPSHKNQMYVLSDDMNLVSMLTSANPETIDRVVALILSIITPLNGTLSELIADDTECQRNFASKCGTMKTNTCGEAAQCEAMLGTLNISLLVLHQGHTITENNAVNAAKKLYDSVRNDCFSEEQAVVDAQRAYDDQSGTVNESLTILRQVRELLNGFLTVKVFASVNTIAISPSLDTKLFLNDDPKSIVNTIAISPSLDPKLFLNDNPKSIAKTLLSMTQHSPNEQNVTQVIDMIDRLIDTELGKLATVQHDLGNAQTALAVCRQHDFAPPTAAPAPCTTGCRWTPEDCQSKPAECTSECRLKKEECTLAQSECTTLASTCENYATSLASQQGHLNHQLRTLYEVIEILMGIRGSSPTSSPTE